MAIKVLFFDTSAVLKLFIEENGSDVMKWLEQNKVSLQLHFVVNEQVCSEFSKKINEFGKTGRLSRDKAKRIIRIFFECYAGKTFRVVGQEIISNTKQEQSLEQIIKELKLTKGKNDWDALHYQSIVNALAYLGGQSHPIFVTGDTSFAKKMSQKGYRVINLTKQSIEEIKKILA